MKKIIVPADILVNGNRYRFIDYLINNPIKDKEFFGKTLKTLMAADRLILIFKNAVANTEVEVRDDDWALLGAAVRDPSSGYLPEVALAFLPFLRFITGD